MKKIPNIKYNPLNRKNYPLLKIVRYVSIIIGSAILIISLITVIYSDSFINSFVKKRIINSFEEAYPSYSIKFGEIHYNVWTNLLECDSIFIKSNDSTLICSGDSISVNGIGWMKILFNGGYSPSVITNTTLDAQNILINFPKSQNELHFGMFHLSVPDSELVADSIKYFSLKDDEDFFNESKYRQTRFRLNVPKIKMTKLDFPALLQGAIYKAGNIEIHDLTADILVNMDKPSDRNSTKPKMPNEIFSSIKEAINIDRLKIVNGKLKYRERYKIGKIPGVITFNKVNISIMGISNNTVKQDTAIVYAQALFMNSSLMKVSMAIPLASKDFSLHYSGTLNKMDATELNKFLEHSEYRRIKSGIIYSAEFNIFVKLGNANGNLRVVYDNLSIAILDKNTRSEKGFFDRLSSLIGKTFIVRGSNMPDEKGLVEIGIINHSRKTDETFIQFIWFSLRSGVGNLVGF